jgi:hypothetical protein
MLPEIRETKKVNMLAIACETKTNASSVLNKAIESSASETLEDTLEDQVIVVFLVFYSHLSSMIIYI